MATSSRHPKNANITKRRPLLTVAAIAVAALTLALLTGCVQTRAAPTPLRATATHNAVQPAISAPKLDQPAITSLASISPLSDYVVGVPVKVSLAGAFPSRGITLTRQYAAALPTGAAASFVYYDTTAGTWTAVPSTLSANRLTLTAVVHHLSWWDDVVAGTSSAIDAVRSDAKTAGQSVEAAAVTLNGAATKVNDAIASAVAQGGDALYWGIGDLFSVRVELPDCTGATPAWVQAQTLDTGVNDSIRFCMGQDPSNPNTLFVKARVNRGFGFPFTLGVTGATTTNSGDDPSLADLLAAVGGLDKSIGQSVSQLGLAGNFVGAGKELDLSITPTAAENFNDVNPVITFTLPSIPQVLASTLAQALTAYGINATDGAGAAIVAVAACTSSLADIKDPLNGAAALLTCLSGIGTTVAKTLSLALAKTGMDAETAGALAGKIVGKALLALAFIGPVISIMDYAGESASGDGLRTLHIAVIKKYLTDPTNPATWVISSAGIGPITIGMTEAQMNASGIPSFDGGDTDGCMYGNWPLGTGISQLVAYADGTPSDSWIAVTYDGDPHTLQGIHIGSTLGEALSAYPGADWEPKLQTEDGFELVKWQSNGVWISFDGDDTAMGGLTDPIESIVVGSDVGIPSGAC